MNHNINRPSLVDGPLAQARLRAMRLVSARGMSDAEWMERAKAIQQSVARYRDLDVGALAREASERYIRERNDAIKPRRLWWGEEYYIRSRGEKLARVLRTNVWDRLVIFCKRFWG